MVWKWDVDTSIDSLFPLTWWLPSPNNTDTIQDTLILSREWSKHLKSFDKGCIPSCLSPFPFINPFILLYSLLFLLLLIFSVNGYFKSTPCFQLDWKIIQHFLHLLTWLSCPRLEYYIYKVYLTHNAKIASQIWKKSGTLRQISYDDMIVLCKDYFDISFCVQYIYWNSIIYEYSSRKQSIFCSTNCSV